MQAFLKTEPTFVSSVVASAKARRIYMEVKIVVKKKMFEALRSVLPNSNVELVFIFISQYRNILTTMSMISLIIKKTEKCILQWWSTKTSNPSMSKNCFLKYPGVTNLSKKISAFDVY